MRTFSKSVRVSRASCSLVTRTWASAALVWPGSSAGVAERCAAWANGESVNNRTRTTIATRRRGRGYSIYDDSSPFYYAGERSRLTDRFSRTGVSAPRATRRSPSRRNSSRPPSQSRRCPSSPTWTPGTISVLCRVLHPVGDVQARRRRVVLDEPDGACLRLPPGQAAAKAGDPLARDRQVVPQDVAGSARSTVRGSPDPRRCGQCGPTSCWGRWSGSRAASSTRRPDRQDRRSSRCGRRESHRPSTVRS